MSAAPDEAQEKPQGNDAARHRHERHRVLAHLLTDLVLLDPRLLADFVFLDSRLLLHVRLVRERVHGLAELAAGALDLAPELLRRLLLGGGGLVHDLALAFTVSMSRCTLSIASSGLAGPASPSSFLPVSARMAATRRSATPTAAAAIHGSSTVARPRMAAATSAATPYSATAPAPPNMPAPLPACLPFSVSSAWASRISWRIRVDVWRDRSWTSSPSGLSCSGLRKRVEVSMRGVYPARCAVCTSSAPDGLVRWRVSAAALPIKRGELKVHAASASPSTSRVVASRSSALCSMRRTRSGESPSFRPASRSGVGSWPLMP